MNENSSTFERLVLSLESSERQNLLRQLADDERAPDGRDKGFCATEQLEQDDASNPARMKFADEQFLVKLWFRICAFFSSMPIERVYDNYLVGRARKTS